MSVTIASVPTVPKLQLHVPAAFAKHNARIMLRRLSLYFLIIEALFVAYDVHAGHERLAHLGLIFLLSGFSFRPWLSLSSKGWLYAVNEKGIYLRDSTDIINLIGYNIIQWDRYKLLSFHLSEWRGYPALILKCEHKGREQTKTLVFRAEEEKIVNEKFMPWLVAQLPAYTSGATLVV